MEHGLCHTPNLFPLWCHSVSWKAGVQYSSADISVHNSNGHIIYPSLRQGNKLKFIDPESVTVPPGKTYPPRKLIFCSPLNYSGKGKVKENE